MNWTHHLASHPARVARLEFKWRKHRAFRVPIKIIPVPPAPAAATPSDPRPTLVKIR